MFDVISATVIFTVILTLFIFTYRYRVKKISSTSKAVLITGCDTGFGHMLATRLDSEGYKVFAGCMDANGDGARKLGSCSSPALQIIQLDVSKNDEIEEARVFVTDKLMGCVLWAVVNNAGIASHAQFEWLPKSTFEKMMQVNFMGMVNVTREFLPLIRASRGRIINMASMAGRTALPGFTAYSASKFAVIGFSDCLRREMKHFDIKVITIEPSLYKTGIASKANFLLQNDVFWSMAEPAVRRDYGVQFFTNSQLSRKKLMQWARRDVDKVVDCLVHAVTSAYSHHRYAPPRILQVLNDVMNILSIDIQDCILYYVTGLYAKPSMMCPDNQDLHNNGPVLGRRRSYAT